MTETEDLYQPGKVNVKSHKRSVERSNKGLLLKTGYWANSDNCNSGDHPQRINTAINENNGFPKQVVTPDELQILHRAQDKTTTARTGLETIAKDLSEQVNLKSYQNKQINKNNRKSRLEMENINRENITSGKININIEIKKKPNLSPDDVQYGFTMSDSKKSKQTDFELQFDKSKSVNYEITNNPNETKTVHHAVRIKKKKVKKGIFISYSPDSGFIERRFVVELVKQLKENNLAEDIWFDKDERNIDSPCWFSLRMEAVEKCRAAILVLSESFFSSPVSIYEAKTVLERLKSDGRSLKLFSVIFSTGSEHYDIPKSYGSLLRHSVFDLTTEEHCNKSIAEKTSLVLGSMMVDLEKQASIHAPPSSPYVPPDAEFTGEYKSRKICQWNANDLQEWLYAMGVKEFYRQNLAENMVDGFLLMSVTDHDMEIQLGIDSRVMRKKIMQQILGALDKEQKVADNWHLRARTQRSRPNCVYLVYDPEDVRLAQNFKQDLKKKNIQVIHHQKLGQSKEEFLQLNGPQLATATYVLVLLTEAATHSPFVFHEVLFADWLGKKLVTAMFKNTIRQIRPSFKAVLGDCPAVDFETNMYTESMDVLEHHIKPFQTVPGVVLEHSYLVKMAEGLKPLASLELDNDRRVGQTGDISESRVFISYQWDMQSKVDDLRRALENKGYSCWADVTPTMSVSQRGHSSMSTRSTGSHTVDAAGADTLQSLIQRNMKASAVIISCITPKYIQSNNCINDLTLADSLRKPILPILLRYSPWPPEAAPIPVRKILLQQTPVDLSNDKLFKQNIHIFLEKIKTISKPN